MAGAVVALLALGVIYGKRAYVAVSSLWYDYSVEPIERVHVELLSAWLLSRANAPGAGSEEEAFEALVTALDEGGIPELRSIAEDLREETQRKGYEKDDALAGYLTAWNDALDRAGAPFVLRGGALMSPRGPQLFITSGRTLHDGRVDVGSQSARVRVIERVDRTNIRESVLGENVEVAEGGLILSDRVLEFAIDRIWPVLDANAKPTAWPIALVDQVRAEVRRDLPPEAYSVLERLAGVRLAAVEAALGTQSRRRCSGFLFPRVGWRGVSPRDRDVLRRHVSAKDCPGVTEEEFEAVRTFTDRAAAEPDLEEAVSALLAWAARPIALHESRHAADVDVTGSLRDPVPCAACGGLSERARNELSAYTAEFAWTTVPATAAYQVCLAIEGSGGSHRSAIEFLFEELGGDCIVGLPDQQAVRAFERRAFERDEPMAVRDAFPSSLPIPPRARALSQGR